MPTYIVSAAHNLLTVDQKKRVAKEITRAHSEATGAQGFFAQIIFNELPRGSHFIGGVQVETDQVYVHGHVRAGRTEQQKKRLLDDLVESLRMVTGLEKRYLWAYISELPASNMVEYGQVLPKPGAESEWLAALPADDRDYMLGLGNAQ
jgi:phenylpyruvate tautomerase PptA (4-oxalocrotonate tautomerase family)